MIEPPQRVADLSGIRYGRLVVVGYAGKSGRNHKWTCICDCGATATRRADHLKEGRSASCGCLNIETQRQSFEKHGGAALDKSKRHPLYSIWCGMKKRCYSPNSSAYPFYGGRGISVCDAWRNDFAAFVRDMGPRPDGTTLDRVDTDGDYSPENCRWADWSTQMKNRRAFSRQSRALSEQDCFADAG